jgi:hypothetical protein
MKTLKDPSGKTLPSYTDMMNVSVQLGSVLPNQAKGDYTYQKYLDSKRRKYGY